MTEVIMKRTFTIEMDDNTTIEAILAISMSTDDEFYAEKQINRISANDLLMPAQDIITTIMCLNQDDELEDDDDDILTADDYPESAE